MDDGFCYWLSGFMDGEATFFINGDDRREQINFYCGVKVVLRDDDAPLINAIHATTGIGHVRRNDWHHRQRMTNRPTIAWEVGRRSELLSLIAILDRYPLRSKKAKDYAIWREAVLDSATPKDLVASGKGGRTPRDWSRVKQLKAELAAVRAYR